MLNYLFVIVGLAVLCAVWGILQLWVKKQHSDTVILKSGCAHCDNTTCSEKE